MTGENNFQNFARWFHRQTGMDLSHYNNSQVQRRLRVVMGKYGYASLEQLRQEAEETPGLLQECLAKLTINVSEFFRDRQYWEQLAVKIPQLAEGRPLLRVWSVGCSHGQEVYSLVYTLARQLPMSQFHVWASDVDADALAAAKTGIYQQSSLDGLAGEQQRVMFKRQGTVFQIRERIRNQVTFMLHDVLRDHLPGDFDLVLCRNVMIHFSPKAKTVAVQRLAESLTLGGLLFVGAAEQIFKPEELGLAGEDVYFYRKTGI